MSISESQKLNSLKSVHKTTGATPSVTDTLSDMRVEDKHEKKKKIRKKKKQRGGRKFTDEDREFGNEVKAYKNGIRKDRLRILPYLYQSQLRLMNRIVRMEAVTDRLMDAIFLRLDDEKLVKDGEQDGLTLKQMMKYLTSYYKLTAEGMEVIRRFMIYFPVELSTDQRKILLMFNSIESPSVRDRLLRYMSEIIQGSEELPRYKSAAYDHALDKVIGEERD